MKSTNVQTNIKSFSNFLKDLEKNLAPALLEAQDCLQVTDTQEQNLTAVSKVVIQAFDATFSVFSSTNLTIAIILTNINQVVKSLLEKQKQKNKATQINSIILTIIKELKLSFGQLSKTHQKELKKLFDVDQKFPAKDSSIYQDMLLMFEKKLLYFVAKAVLPTKWKIRQWPTYTVRDNYCLEEDQHQSLYDFDHFKVNSFTDMSYMVQRFNALPDENLGVVYEHTTTDGHVAFQNWLKQLCTDRRNTLNYNSYSSYYNWKEEADYKEGNKFYKAYKIHNVILVNYEGKKAPVALTEWLFKDDVYGNVSALNGVATREDVYKNWNLGLFK